MPIRSLIKNLELESEKMKKAERETGCSPGLLKLAAPGESQGELSDLRVQRHDTPTWTSKSYQLGSF